MQRIKTALVWLGVWALLMWPTLGAVRAQDIFIELTRPKGIGVDNSGDVYVHSEGVSTTLLSKLMPDGTELLQASLGSPPVDYLRFVESHLVIDPAPQADRLYVLSPEGDLVILDASTLEESGRLNIQDLTVDTNDVYDVATSNSTSNFVLSPFATFGDIAAFRPNSGADGAVSFVTGLSDGMAFVMRIPMGNAPSGVSGAKVLLVSTLASPTTLNRTRGVASFQNSVLTTLPSPLSNSACPDVVIRFSATASSLDQSNVSDLSGTTGVPSWGMSSGPSGVYLVTGGVQNASCLQGGDGVLAFIPASLTGIGTIVSLPSFANGRPGDVAIGSNSGVAYVTVPDYNTVLSFPLSSVSSLPLP